MSLPSYLRWLGGNWAWVAISTLAGVILALACSLLTTPQFVAKSEIFLSTPRFGNVSVPADSPFLADGFAQQRARSYIQLASRVDLARRVDERLGIDRQPEELASAITAWTPPDTVLIDVSVQSSSPTDAKILADAVTAELATDIRNLEGRSGQIIPLVEPVVTMPAETPTKPSEPQTVVYLLFGASGGFLAGVTAAAIRQRKRIEVTELEQITSRPVLGAIVSESAASDESAEERSATSNRDRWQWNEVLKNLARETDQTGDRVLAVTTENGSVRSSAAAAALATACANAGSRVVLLLMHPHVPKQLGEQEPPDVAQPRPPNTPPRHRSSDYHLPTAGFADLVVGEVRLEAAIQHTDNQNLYYVTGPAQDNVAPLLRSEKLHEIIEQLRESFDLVILDSPDFFQLAACSSLPEAIDSIILVIQEMKVDKPNLEVAVRLISEKKMRLLGSILDSDPAVWSQAGDDRSPVRSHERLDR